LVAAEITDVGV
jgi:hypothetical protein